MKKIFLFLLAFSIFIIAILFAFYETTWNCTAKIIKGISISSVDTSGAFISESNYRIADQNSIRFNLRSNGSYKFRYSDNVSKVLLWSGQEKIYEGPPVATFNIGKGIVGIDIYAEGNAFVDVSSECSIGGFVKSF